VTLSVHPGYAGRIYLLSRMAEGYAIGRPPVHARVIAALPPVDFLSTWFNKFKP
jgi:hypothetical protein